MDSAPLTGHFAWDTERDEWHWSDAVYELYGYAPGAVTPSTQLVVSHKTDPHRPRTEELFEQSTRPDFSFSMHHQIFDASGGVRTILSVGRAAWRRHAGTGRVQRMVQGFVSDLTEVERRAGDEAVRAARVAMAPIHQALGVVMSAYGLDEEAAMSLLRRHSSMRNAKISRIAREVVHASVTGALSVGHAERLGRLLQEGGPVPD